MAAKPGSHTPLGDADCWGIEPMVSDVTSRGFGREQTHLRAPDRLARLILVMSLALSGAVATGMWDHVNNPTPAEKKPERQPAKRARGRLSWFTRGIRRAIKLLLECLPLPKLWGCLLN